MGDYSLTRWTYEPTTKTCVPFDYHGFQGNQNNFLTREDCERRCPVYENPCKAGEPFLINNRPQICNPNSPCPSNYYCHIGARDEAMCCPVQGGDPCGQPMDRGLGSSQLQRWYWNMAQQRCLPFNYCGQKGTQNNFLSQQDCERTCYEMDNPCALGTPQLGTDNRPLQCSLQSNACGPSFWCHIGAVPQTTVCCPGRVPEPQVCQQPMALGSGDASLPRWFYDQFQRKCVQFTYKGRYGNQNNFLTQQACEGACNVYVNVCPYGEPLLEGGRPKPCTFGSDSCGPNHWCHLGLVPDEYQCCPGEPRNPAACNGLPSAVGVAGAPAPPASRWFFDTADKTCKEFQYQGRKGNQNNFLTEEDCKKTCDVFVNPCNLPISMPPQSCSPTANTCGAGSWCHVGETPQTTICCPSEGDPCLLPQARGTGSGFLDRWYYDAQTGSCQPFTYTGVRGNQNNFLSRADCEQTCAPNPCAEGRPFMGVDGRAQTCSASANMNTCPSGYWCHIGAATPTTVCCPGASNNICNLPMSTGEGNANLERFYFDSLTKTCRSFSYGGLKGNQNNFLSLRACQLSCQPLDNPCIGQPATTAAGQILFCSATNKDTCPVNFWCHLGATPETTVCCPGATNPCSVPLAPGTGNSNLARWYYNADDRACVPFEYNGKRGNQNNFETQAECQRTCPVFENPCMGDVEKVDGKPRKCSPIKGDSCGRGHFCLAVEGDIVGESGYCCPSMGDPCNTYLNEGEGLKQLPRWYFNPRTQQCHPFTYRGKKGNENNFLTQRTCEERCQPIENACFGGEEPLRREGRILQCQHNSGCPHSHYCHQGVTPRASVCCKKRGDVCDQQLMAGIGDASLARFHYSQVDDRCVEFNYTGLGGNENNFLSRQECELACPGYKGYCPHGKPLVQKGKIQTCGISTICPRNYLCHVTRKETRSVCCSDPAHFCLMEKDPGPCDQKLVKYAYNRTMGICQRFEYGGCSGNLNNFDSLETCTEQLCLLSIDRGACGGRVTRFAFDRRTNSCISFEYTGCGGNLNNFQSLEDCRSTCGQIGFR
ncbi:hypothetical protein QR680_006309 [Steinernema hermaphroditum]|uniref:BPTI/Kunitz inhibitor domain-containing protein n=1 Tax=Steinernema hermaphroditum TaxID=289476 RepID=A0AA39HV38_9BILA|nr:hypothetical protein QR680_006309 [Steinernema hermaphroditum]